MDPKLKSRNLFIHPASLVITSFALTDLAGAALLLLPVCHKGPLSFLDALFTSTSAICVTGLTVVNTAYSFTVLGQWVILLLIQVGGLGVMTFSVLFTMSIRGRPGLSSQFLIQESFLNLKAESIQGLILTILLFTLACEGGLALAMTAAFLPDAPTPGDALFYGLFHSVSAFCNAGFSVFPYGLEAYRDHVWVNIAVMTGVFLGSTGFAVIYEIWQRIFEKKRRPWSLHLKITLGTHVLLMLVGTAGFLFWEYNEVLRGMPLFNKVLVSAFHSVSARTAGFNTVPISALTENTLYLMILLMFIGACPSSTGGGIKTTTVAVLFFTAKSRLKGFGQTVAFKKTIPEGQVDRAITLFMLAVITVLSAHMLLMGAGTRLAFERAQGEFLAYLFEAVSGLGTVGLSVGITPKLGYLGKCVMIAIMFAGRVGLLSIISILSAAGGRSREYHYSKEDVMIG